MVTTNTRPPVTAVHGRNVVNTTGVTGGAIGGIISSPGQKPMGAGVNTSDVARSELGHTRDPAWLIPGDPEQLHQLARSFIEDSRAHDDIAARIRAHAAGSSTWVGVASDGFRHHLTQRVTGHHRASDATRTAADALTILAGT